MAEPGDFLYSLLELLGLSTEGTGERVQAIALLVFLVLFGLIAAIFTVGLARQLWGAWLDYVQCCWWSYWLKANDEQDRWSQVYEPFLTSILFIE